MRLASDADPERRASRTSGCGRQGARWFDITDALPQFALGTDEHARDHGYDDRRDGKEGAMSDAARARFEHGAGERPRTGRSSATPLPRASRGGLARPRARRTSAASPATTAASAVDRPGRTCLQTAICLRPPRRSATRSTSSARCCTTSATRSAAFNHPDVAAAILKPFVSEENHWMVEKHAHLPGLLLLPSRRHATATCARQFRGHPCFERTAEFCDALRRPGVRPEARDAAARVLREPMLPHASWPSPKRSMYVTARADA